MSFNRDIVDYILLDASTTGNCLGTSRRITFKGRQVGKTAFAQQLLDMHKAAWSPMPQMSKPRTTATGNAFKISDVQTITQLEILPRCMRDAGSGVIEFSNWRVTFIPDPNSSAFYGVVAAERNSDHMTVYKRFDLDLDQFQLHAGPTVLVNVLDTEIEKAVRWIVNYQRKLHDLTTCTDPECYC